MVNYANLAGGLQTATEQQRLVDPRKMALRHFTRWCLLAAYLTAIHRSQLSYASRVQCYTAVLKYLFQFKKWRRVLYKSLSGRGTGGDVPVPTT